MIPNQQKFDEIKREAEKMYQDISSVHCPFLKKSVNFNAKGLDHIKLKEWNKTRLVSDQYLRFKFLKLASRIIEKSGTLQEYNEVKNFERIKTNSKWNKKLILVKYYGFLAIFNFETRVKVIVKEIDGGEPYFWSIIPFWKNKKNDITNEIKKVFHEGDLEND